MMQVGGRLNQALFLFLALHTAGAGRDWHQPQRLPGVGAGAEGGGGGARGGSAAARGAANGRSRRWAGCSPVGPQGWEMAAWERMLGFRWPCLWFVCAASVQPVPLMFIEQLHVPTVACLPAASRQAAAARHQG